MSGRSIPVLVEHDAGGRSRVRSPGVGWWSDPPDRGEPLAPGNAVGTLTRLGRRFALVLPDGTRGRVVEVITERNATAVEYGQELFVLVAAGTTSDDPRSASAGAPRVAREDGSAEWSRIVAPTDGIFYHRPSPDAAPYVEVGGPVKRGQTVGLVEVMKTFNQLVFEGPGFPSEAVVKEIVAGEGEEVRSGQVLIVLEA